MQIDILSASSLAQSRCRCGGYPQYKACRASISVTPYAFTLNFKQQDLNVKQGYNRTEHFDMILNHSRSSLLLTSCLLMVFPSHISLICFVFRYMSPRKHFMYEGHLESKERFAIKKYLLIIGKKKNMQVLSHTFTYFSTQSTWTLRHLSYRDTSLLIPSS